MYTVKIQTINCRTIATEDDMGMFYKMKYVVYFLKDNSLLWMFPLLQKKTEFQQINSNKNQS